MSHLFDIIKFVLTSFLLLWSMKRAFLVLKKSGNSLSARGRIALRWMVGATTGLIFLSAFTYWVYPTPWQEWEQHGRWYRINRLTGQKQQLMECGCNWFTVEE